MVHGTCYHFHSFSLTLPFLSFSLTFFWLAFSTKTSKSKFFFRNYFNTQNKWKIMWTVSGAKRSAGKILCSLLNFLNFLIFFPIFPKKKKVLNSRKTLQSTKTPSPNHPKSTSSSSTSSFSPCTSIFSSSLMINGFIFEFMYIKMQCIFFNNFFVPSYAVVENYIFILMLQHIFDTKQKQQWHKKKYENCFVENMKICCHHREIHYK